jgi:hypothetical protein
MGLVPGALYCRSAARAAERYHDPTSASYSISAPSAERARRRVDRPRRPVAAASWPTIAPFNALTEATLARRPIMSGCGAWRSPRMSVNESMRFYHEKSTMSLAASLTGCSCPPCGEMGPSELGNGASHNGYWSFMTAPGHFCAPDPTLAERRPRCSSETSFTDLAPHSSHQP